MPLTVTEKEHWKDRVNARISKRIEQIWAENEEIKVALEMQAEEEILSKFDLKEKYKEITEAKEEKSALEDRISRLELQMIERLAKHLGHVNQYSWETRLKGEINKVKQRLMKDTEPGRQVAQLESEKENSLDAVWLATSNKQIRELWTQVGSLIGSENSILTKSALEIEPSNE